ncbi:MAG: NUDIX domain-containing protein [Gammaproteobacteria bacterium]|nr:NUDIX domain-containing protein [Gammaproteobacteria bacterium]MCP5300959.1 NUDIX domain-containing protein [Chromatiaceae bacterium]
MSSTVPNPTACSENAFPSVRNAVRALIARRNQVLMLRKLTPDGSVRYALPGGGQCAGETLLQTLLRECAEEIGTTVDVAGLAHVAETSRPPAGRKGESRQQVEFVFSCRIADDYEPRNGPRPDKRQVGVEWVGLQYLDQLDVRPPGMGDLIRRMAIGEGPVYVGRLPVGG